MNRDSDIVSEVERELQEFARQPVEQRPWNDIAGMMQRVHNRRAVRRARLVGLLCGLLAAAGASAGVQGVRAYFFPVSSTAGVRLEPLPVNEDGTATLNFIDENGNRRAITITPEMIGGDQAVRGMQWNEVSEEPIEHEPRPEEQPPL